MNNREDLNICRHIIAVLLLLFSIYVPVTYLLAGSAGKTGSDYPAKQAQPGPKVILKADNFAMQTSLADWVKFFDFLDNNDLSASIGVLGKPLSKKSKEELAEMRTLLEKNKDSIEL